MAEKLVFFSPGSAQDGHTCTAHIARWMLEGRQRDTGWMLDFVASAGSVGLIWDYSKEQTGQKPSLLHLLPHSPPGRMLQDPPAVIACCLGGSGKPAHPGAGVPSALL